MTNRRRWRRGAAGVVALVVLTLAAPAAAAPPPNDDLVDAWGPAYSNSNAEATKEPGEPNHAGNAGGHSVWFTGTAPAGGRFSVSTCGAGFDTLLAVYTASGWPPQMDSLDEVASNDDSSQCGAGSTGSVVSATLPEGTPYYVAVDGKNGATGQFPIEIASNDAFAGAHNLGDRDSRIAGATNAGATKEPSEPNHAGDAGGRSVWYRFTPDQSGEVQLDTCETDAMPAPRIPDTLLAVYTGSSVGSLTEVASDDDAPGCGPGGKLSRVRFFAVEGTTYRIAVDGKDGAAGYFLLVRHNPVPNDDFGAAANLPTGVPVDLTMATKQPGEPAHAGIPTGGSAWYRFTPTESKRVRIDACGSGDTGVAVYTGATLTSLHEVASNDDSPGCGVGDRGGRVSFDAVAGVTYRVAVVRRGDAWAEVTVRLFTPNGNDDFADAEELDLENGEDSRFVPGTAGATTEPGEPSHAGQGSAGSVWYRYTPSQDGELRLDTCAEPADTVLAVYTGSGVSQLNEVASNDDASGCGQDGKGSRLSFQGQGGTTYWIALAEKAGRGEPVILYVQGRPANDDFAHRTDLGPSFPFAGINVNLALASKQPGEPAHAGDAGGRSAWYSFTPTQTGDVTIRTCASSPAPGPTGDVTDTGTYDTLLAVYTGSSVGSLTEVASNDDTPGCTGGTGSQVTFQAQAGTTYHVALDFKTGATRRRAWLEFAGRPWNDDFDHALDVGTDLPATFQTATNQATGETGEPQHAGDAGGKSVWYRLTPARDGPVSIRACSGFDAVVAVYEGTSLGALTPVGSDGDGTCGFDRPLSFDGDAAKTYYVAVDGKQGAGGWLNVTFQADDGPPAPTIGEPSEGATTADGTPTLSGTAGTAPDDESTVTVKVVSGRNIFTAPVREYTVPVGAGGQWSVKMLPPLAGGVYTAQATQRDSAGNIGLSNERRFRVPTVVPQSSSGSMGTGSAPGSVGGDAGVRISATTLTAGASTFTVPVRNGNPFPVAGSLSAVTSRPVVVSRRARPMKIGTARFRLAARSSRRVRVRLSRRARRLLARKRRLRVRLTVSVRQPQAARHKASYVVTLRVKRRR